VIARFSVLLALCQKIGPLRLILALDFVVSWCWLLSLLCRTTTTAVSNLRKDASWE
jgi:hypothetical protein